MRTETMQQALHYDAMSIGLVLAATKPRSYLYVLVDGALVRQDWDLLRALWRALRALPPREQARLRGATGEFFQLGEAVSHLEATFYIQGALEN